MWTVSFLRTASHLPGADLRFNKSPPPNVVECNLLLTLPTTSFRNIQHRLGGRGGGGIFLTKLL